MDNTDNIKELYVLEEPIETRIGLLYPMLVGNYKKLIKFNGVISLDKNALINHFTDLTKQNNEFQAFLDIVKELSMFDFIKFCGVDDYKGSFLYDLYVQFKELLELCFKADVFHLIETSEEFDEYINIIRDVNNIKYEPTSPNPEIERRNNLKRKLESMKSENITFEDMFTSVCVGLSKLPSEVNTMTIYDFYKIFARIGQFKNYDTSTLFATVSKEAKIETWYKSIDTKKDLTYITAEQLDRAKQGQKLQSDL